MATSSSVASWEQASFGTLLSYPFSLNRSLKRVSLLVVSLKFHFFPSHAPTPVCRGWIVLHAFIHALACCNTTEHSGSFSQTVLLLRDSLKLCTLSPAPPSKCCSRFHSRQSSCGPLCPNTWRTLYFTTIVKKQTMPCWLFLLGQWYFYIRIVA